MKRLRVLIAVLAIAVCCAVTLAQPDKPLAIRPSLPQGWKKLGLTDAQRDQVYKVQIDYRGKIAALEAQIKDLRAQERQDLLKILTDAQKARLKEIREEKVNPTPKPEPPAITKPKTEDKKPDKP